MFVVSTVQLIHERSVSHYGMSNRSRGTYATCIGVSSGTWRTSPAVANTAGGLPGFPFTVSTASGPASHPHRHHRGQPVKLYRPLPVRTSTGATSTDATPSARAGAPTSNCQSPAPSPLSSTRGGGWPAGRARRRRSPVVASASKRQSTTLSEEGGAERTRPLSSTLEYLMLWGSAAARWGRLPPSDARQEPTK